MMSTLLMRLAAPMQSWGTDSKFNTRRTGMEPTKSGVIGLLASALGRRRDDNIDDLRKLRFGVRVDREGELLRDFQTVEGEKTSCFTYRYYLCDAIFLAGVESDDEGFLTELDEALQNPAHPLFLGRRSCPPDQPVSLGIRHTGLRNALEDEPWLVPEFLRNKYQNEVSLRIIMDADGQGDMAVKDLPLSYDPRYRQYGYRAIKESEVPVVGSRAYKHGSGHEDAGLSTDHDPMKEL